jgi:hypothetical protein
VARVWLGWVFEGSRDLPRCLRRQWLGSRRVAGAGQFRSTPVHRSESPTGYSSAGCSPAEPASASPVTDNSSSIPIRRDNQMRCSTSLKDTVQASWLHAWVGQHPGQFRISFVLAQRLAVMQCRVAPVVSAATGGVTSTLRAGCHFYLAPTLRSCIANGLPGPIVNAVVMRRIASVFARPVSCPWLSLHFFVREPLNPLYLGKLIPKTGG